MEIRFHRTFLKHYEKLPEKVKKRFQERIIVFSNDPSDVVLRNHPLKGDWIGRRSISISITGDYRAVYKAVETDIALFEAIGTHSQLYR